MDNTRDVRDIPGALDVSGPSLAWDEMDKGDYQKAALFFETWISEYIGSKYMEDPAFRGVIGAAVLDYCICLTSFALDSNISKSIGMLFLASDLNPSASGDCLQNILFVLDRVLSLKTTKLMPLDAESFYSEWAQTLLNAWFSFQRKDYRDALRQYDSARVLLDNKTEVMPGLILSSYAVYKETNDSIYLEKAIGELREFKDSHYFTLAYFSAPVCATETVKSKAADLAILKSSVKRYRLMDLNTFVKPKAEDMTKLKGLGNVEIEFPLEIKAIQFYSMGTVRQSKFGGQDFIELVGSVFCSEQPALYEKHVGNIHIHVHGAVESPTYETSWELIEWLDDDNFIKTTSRGDRLRNGAIPIE